MPPFYIMENKVWNGLYRWYRKENPEAAAKSAWVDDNADDWLPAVSMPIDEAVGFCQWIGGKLPSRPQWDFAAGYPQFRDRIGTTDAVVGRSPRSVREGNDVTPWGIRDMYGNGFEFTRDLTDGRTAPIPFPVGDEMIVLRGRAWMMRTPLSADDLDKEPINYRTQRYRIGGGYTSFRVVIDLPN
jgi:formylglycine-generating enzyme required for sulfatase activity